MCPRRAPARDHGGRRRIQVRLIKSLSGLSEVSLRVCDGPVAIVSIRVLISSTHKKVNEIIIPG